jgi:hypothetical protein
MHTERSAIRVCAKQLKLLEVAYPPLLASGTVEVGKVLGAIEPGRHYQLLKSSGDPRDHALQDDSMHLGVAHQAA